jgi:hypothetical protein
MKKFIYSLIIVGLSFSAFTSCTEEEVKPQSDNSNAGGVPIRE